MMSTLQLLCVPETEVRSVETAYEGTHGKVIIGAGISGQFGIDL